MYDFKRVMRKKLAEQDQIEYTLISNGLFMDYLLPKGSKKYLKDVTIPVNVEERKARIPVNGEAPVTMTYADDVGKAIIKLVEDTRPWPLYTYIHGATTTWDQLVKLGEECTGEKFEVEYVSMEKLQEAVVAAKATGDPRKIFFASVDIYYAGDILSLPQHSDPTLFQDVNFKQPKEMISEWYGKKQ